MSDKLDWQEQFNKLYLENYKLYDLELTTHSDYQKDNIKVTSKGRTIINITVESDRIMSFKDEDDDAEVAERRNMAYYRAHNDLKSWLRED